MPPQFDFRIDEAVPRERPRGRCQRGCRCWRPGARRWLKARTPPSSAARFLVKCRRIPGQVSPDFWSNAFGFCNRGQVYCSGACSARSRTERRREARGRYRRTEKGRETGRRRQRRYRIRQADLARAAARITRITGTAAAVLSGGGPTASGDAGSEKTVTDHPSEPPPAPLAEVPTARSGHESPLRCAVCGRVVTHVVLADP